MSSLEDTKQWFERLQRDQEHQAAKDKRPIKPFTHPDFPKWTGWTKEECEAKMKACGFEPRLTE